jgi:hypothetical protein
MSGRTCRVVDICVSYSWYLTISPDAVPCSVSLSKRQMNPRNRELLPRSKNRSNKSIRCSEVVLLMDRIPTKPPMMHQSTSPSMFNARRTKSKCCDKRVARVWHIKHAGSQNPRPRSHPRKTLPHPDHHYSQIVRSFVSL